MALASIRQTSFYPVKLADTFIGPLARIIHIFEDNKSLLCYKHVVETMFAEQKRLLNV